MPFAAMSDIPTRLIAFSDDMDGLRKVPENVPEQEMLTGHLGKPLTAVPDPFGTHDSSARTTTHACRRFSTRSASTTISAARPRRIAPVSSTRRC